MQDSIPQSRRRVMLAVPIVHPIEQRWRMTDHDGGPFGDHLQVRIRDERGNLENLVALGVETAHLEIHPDQTFGAWFGHLQPSGARAAVSSGARRRQASASIF